MRSFALNNDRASALHVYHTCVTTLQRDLDVEPDPATREAYERLMQQEAPTIRPIVHQPLPAATPTLIGREREWGHLHDAWQRETLGGPHFVLVTGEAGVGKSRALLRSPACFRMPEARKAWRETMQELGYEP